MQIKNSTNKEVEFPFQWGRFAKSVVVIISSIFLWSCNSNPEVHPTKINESSTSNCNTAAFEKFFETKKIQTLVEFLDPETKRYFTEYFPKNLPDLTQDYSVSIYKESKIDSTCHLKFDELVMIVRFNSDGKVFLAEEQFLLLFRSEPEICYEIGMFQLQKNNVKMARRWFVQSASNGNQKAIELIRDNSELW